MGGVQCGVEVAGLRWVERGMKPRQKQRLLPTGSGITGSKVCPVCVELNPSAANAPPPCEIAPKLLSSSDLAHTHTHTHTHTHYTHISPQEESLRSFVCPTDRHTKGWVGHCGNGGWASFSLVVARSWVLLQQTGYWCWHGLGACSCTG